MPTSRSHNPFPPFRSKQRARSVLLFSSVELTKTESPQIIGVAADGPGNAADHLTFCVLENSTGRFFSLLDPLKYVPRQCAQFSASAAPASNGARTIGVI